MQGYNICLRIILLFFCSVCFIFTLSGQTQGINRQAEKVHIHKISEEINIDGLLDEKIWKVAERATGFRRVLPTDTGFAKSQTEVMLAYDKNWLYLAIICHDAIAGKRPVESLRRDFTFGKNDNFIVFIDTYNDFTNVNKPLIL